MYLAVLWITGNHRKETTLLHYILYNIIQYNLHTYTTLYYRKWIPSQYITLFYRNTSLRKQLSLGGSFHGENSTLSSCRPFRQGWLFPHLPDIHSAHVAISSEIWTWGPVSRNGAYEKYSHMRKTTNKWLCTLYTTGWLASSYLDGTSKHQPLVALLLPSCRQGRSTFCHTLNCRHSLAVPRHPIMNPRIGRAYGIPTSTILFVGGTLPSGNLT